MKFSSIYYMAMLSLIPLAIGCGKGNASAPQGIASDKVPTVINQAFNQASDANRQLAANYVSDFQNQNTALAFADLDQILRSHELSPEERDVARHAMVTTMQQLRDAAKSGNQQAQNELHHYLISR